MRYFSAGFISFPLPNGAGQSRDASRYQNSPRVSFWWWVTVLGSKLVRSGNDLHSYWKWPMEIVDLPTIKNDDFPYIYIYIYIYIDIHIYIHTYIYIYMLVYQRVVRWNCVKVPWHIWFRLNFRSKCNPLANGEMLANINDLPAFLWLLRSTQLLSELVAQSRLTRSSVHRSTGCRNFGVRYPESSRNGNWGDLNSLLKT